MAQVQKLPASRGLAWLAGSLALLRSQLARLLLIGLAMQFLLGFTQAGVLGILFVLAVPALSAGVLQAMFSVEQGVRPPLLILFSAFSSPQRLMRLLVLAVIMIAVGTLTAGLMLSGSMEALTPELLSRLERGDVEALAMIDPVALQRIVLSVLAGVAVSGSIGYFAIPLIWFRGQSTGTAILSGLTAMLRNWLPFLVMGALLTVMAIPVVIIIATLFSTPAAGSGASIVLTLIMLLVMVIYQLLLFGTQYLSFKEVFGTGMAPPGSEGSHLVA